MTQSISRRQFIQGLAGALAAPMVVPSRVLGQDAPSNKLNMAMIGAGWFGFAMLDYFMNDTRVNMLAVCDVNKESAGYNSNSVKGREPARRKVNSFYGNQNCQVYEDFRELLARGDLDCVGIATPDQWHAIPTIEAAKAKIHVYCQKPLSLTVAEGRLMANAVHENGIVFQCGSQQRSGFRFRRACELVLNGRIGKLQKVNVNIPGGAPDLSGQAHRDEPEPIPEGFNYDFWLGQAPERPYIPARSHVNFRWFYDYSGGMITDWGAHHIDIGQWGMGMEKSGPIAIKNAAATFATGVYNTPIHYAYDCVYQNGVVMNVSNTGSRGVEFHGEDGWIFVSRGGWDANPTSVLEEEIGAGDIQLIDSNDHYRNFIDGIIDGKPTIAPIEDAHRTATLCHLGNIALQLGRDLKWDPQTETVYNDGTAQQMLSRKAHEPWDRYLTPHSSIKSASFLK